ncbi:tetraspanin, partial [Plakobranchus ocellatus]
STLNLTSPVFCCKLDGKFPDITLPSNLDCATSPNATTSNYVSGCYQAVEDYIMGYRLALIVGVSLLIACQVGGVKTRPH